MYVRALLYLFFYSFANCSLTQSHAFKLQLDAPRVPRASCSEFASSFFKLQLDSQQPFPSPSSLTMPPQALKLERAALDDRKTASEDAYKEVAARIEELGSVLEDTKRKRAEIAKTTTTLQEASDS